MTEAADLILTNAEVHTLAGPADSVDDGDDQVHEAVAVRDGAVVRVGDAYEVDFLAGVDTTVRDLGGAVVLPGFVDAHTHMEQVGQFRLHADLGAATDRDDAVERLAAGARDDREWVLGFGYDESEWPGGDYLTREDLDAVSEARPVAAIRVDMHTASLNSVALERLDFPDDDVETEGGEPTGVVVEDAVEAVREDFAPDPAETRELIAAARDRAHELGVTAVHDMVRDSHAPRAYRELDRAGDLGLRVRINYWSDHLDAVREVGLRTNHGSDMVRVGGIKSFTDGSLGGRTAKLFEPYADGDGTGTWVVDPDEVRAVVEAVDDAGLQTTLHAIGDEAIETALSAYESTDDPGAARHRIEHVELATDDQLARMADAGVVASVQPNFHRWAEAGGLYDRRLGDERRQRTNRLARVVEAGVPLAFGSDVMPFGPLEGVHSAVNAPTDAQSLPVTAALRAYTSGAAYAGFDEDRLGTVESGTAADFTVLDRSPWEQPDAIRDIDVVATVVAGDLAYDDLS
ncbi:amidohydrolase [Halostella litorea]|uniref:amidohydrolase n=1 Tax=Halostella litorea TaxID=2528831 RepID=UPI001091AAC7|nr:amidohydrolase [Halostella litorea]